jgi:hypothetical protein
VGVVGLVCDNYLTGVIFGSNCYWVWCHGMCLLLGTNWSWCIIEVNVSLWRVSTHRCLQIVRVDLWDTGNR